MFDYGVMHFNNRLSYLGFVSNLAGVCCKERGYSFILFVSIIGCFMVINVNSCLYYPRYTITAKDKVDDLWAEKALTHEINQ